MFQKFKHRLIFMDYKDAQWTTPKSDVVLPNGKVEKKGSASAKVFESIYDLGDGDIDFPACQRALREIGYKAWNCVGLDYTRSGPRASCEHCGQCIRSRLWPL